MNILEKDDIYALVRQNEKERSEIQSLKKRIETNPTNFSNGAFDRQKFYNAFLFDDMHKDGFVMQYPHGFVVRQSDREWHFRGENACYPTSQPTFIRKLSKMSIEEKYISEFVANMKLIDFANMLHELDHYHSFKNTHFTHQGSRKQIFLDVLFTNIAQHYGFDTTWLDITGDFETALFFACCKYSNNKWEPLQKKDFEKNEESKCGRIFRRKANDFRNMNFPYEKYSVFPVGFQPFMRCHMQYAYAIYMDENMDLNKSESGFECLKFRHSEELCNYIYSKMDNGRLIYPHEGLNILSDEINSIQNCSVFSIETFIKVFNNLNFGYSEVRMLELLKNSGIEIVENTKKIAQSKIEHVNNFYENFDIETLYNIKLQTRWTFSPEK